MDCYCTGQDDLTLICRRAYWFCKIVQETLETKKDRRDYGLMLGKMLTNSCTSCGKGKKSQIFKAEDDERAALLGSNGDQATATSNGQSRNKRTPKQPSWSQVFTPQSNLVLLAYASMAMHNMAFDSQFPVLMHYRVQQIKDNPDVQLPFRFAGGFGVGMAFSDPRPQHPPGITRLTQPIQTHKQSASSTP